MLLSSFPARYLAFYNLALKQAFTCLSEATTRKTGNAWAQKQLIEKALNNSTATEHSRVDSKIKTMFHEAKMTRSQKIL